MPSEMYLMARQLSANDRESGLAEDMRRLAAESPGRSEPACDIVHAFGTPKPLLSTSLWPGVAQSAHVSDAHGLFQPHPGGKLGIKSALFYGALADELCTCSRRK